MSHLANRDDAPTEKKRRLKCKNYINDEVKKTARGLIGRQALG